jgi:hypothetical protein
VPEALDFMHLSSASSTLWAAADPAPTPAESAPGEVTIMRLRNGVASQVVGPTTDPEGGNPFTTQPGIEGAHSKNEAVSSIAAEPPGEGEGEGAAAGESAWLALDSGEGLASEPVAAATVARLSSDGAVSERQQLPSAQEALQGVGPKGAADKLACPAPHDCWLATRRGWLFHLTTAAGRQAEEHEVDTDPAFSKPLPITYRPPDAGIPPIVPDAPPVDNSGLPGEAPPLLSTVTDAPAQTEARVPVALLSDVSSRLLHGATLELRFRLAVKARVRLLAKRRRRIVASTPTLTLSAGRRRLRLALSRNRWPTGLALQTHALAPLPTVPAKQHSAATNTIGTSLRAPVRTPSFADLGPLG